jgi:hypothetical protein
VIAGTLFYHPLTVPTDLHLWLLLPLCAAVAIVYKAVRTQHVRRLALDSAVLLAYMVVGLLALGVALWAVVRICQ